MSFRLLVTGGREFTDYLRVKAALDNALSYQPTLCIVNGGARGADELARRWCRETGTPCITMDAPWDKFRNRAGPMRNRWMLQHATPHCVISFPGGVGTADMCAAARQAGVPVYAG